MVYIDICAYTLWLLYISYDVYIYIYHTHIILRCETPPRMQSWECLVSKPRSWKMNASGRKNHWTRDHPKIYHTNIYIYTLYFRSLLRIGLLLLGPIKVFRSLLGKCAAGRGFKGCHRFHLQNIDRLRKNLENKIWIDYDRLLDQIPTSHIISLRIIQRYIVN